MFHLLLVFPRDYLITLLVFPRDYLITLTPFRLQNTTCAEAIIRTKPCDYVINRTSKWARNRSPGSDRLAAGHTGSWV